jgi:anti-sigma factor RsiW
MDAVFSIQGHPTTDTLEEYAFERLSEADTEAVEEHFLACPECQTALAEVDEYIRLMKQAIAPDELSHKARVAPEQWRAGIGALVAAWVPKGGKNRTLTYSIGLLAAAAGIVLVLASGPIRRTIARNAPEWERSGPEPGTGAPESVQLLALRGAASATNHAQARRRLDLNIDLTGIAPDLSQPSTRAAEVTRYRVEIVNAAGAPVWNGESTGSGRSLAVHLTKGLGPGQYWVRLYSSDVLLREFGLLAE